MISTGKCIYCHCCRHHYIYEPILIKLHFCDVVVESSKMYKVRVNMVSGFRIFTLYFLK